MLLKYIQTRDWMTPTLVETVRMTLRGFDRALADAVRDPVACYHGTGEPVRTQVGVRVHRWGRTIGKIMTDHETLWDSLLTLEETAGRNNHAAFKGQIWHFLSAYRTLIDDISDARKQKATFFHFPRANLARGCHGYIFNPNRTRAGALKEADRLAENALFLGDENIQFGPITPNIHYSGDPDKISTGKDASYLARMEFAKLRLYEAANQTTSK